MKIVLASGSPRRAKILRTLGVDFDVVKTDAPETSRPDDPEGTVRANALAKGAAAGRGENVLSADTIVWCGGRIYGKPRDRAEAHAFLRALACGLDIVTDHGRFTPVEGRRSFAVAKGASVSVFATDPATRMTSKGLQWPLDGVAFDNLYCATLNRATAARITLTATRRVYVYFAS